MTKIAEEQKFQMLSTRCGACSCGCPTVFMSEDGDDLVIVGKLDADVLGDSAVSQKIGDGETAVVIPKDLILEALGKLD